MEYKEEIFKKREIIIRVSNMLTRLKELKNLSVREHNRRGFSDLREIFIFFNARYTKHDAHIVRAVS